MEAYRNELEDAGVLKMRAARLQMRASAEERFQASVLWTRAAEAERRALSTLRPGDPVTQADSFAEQATCFIRAGDVQGAMEAASKLLELAERERDPTIVGLAEHVKADVDSMCRAFSSDWQEAPVLQRERRLAIPDPVTREAARLEVSRLCKGWPGAPSMCWAAYRLAHQDGDLEFAWEALGRALELRPADPVYLGFRAQLAVERLPPGEASDTLTRLTDLAGRASDDARFWMLFAVG